MNGVYNRKLFAKKATEARDKLREMGGVQPMPAQMGGIMASSPELMQAAAMRRPVVLPTTQAPVAPTPAPQPVSQMLPPSQPIPNIAGIPQGPAPTAPAPRPMAQKPGVKKLANGGDTFLDHYKSPALKKALGKDFKTTAEFGQKAITSAKAEDLGLPQELTDQMEVRRDEIVNQPEVAAQNNINANVPTDQRTGDLQKDLVKAAKNIGLERVPAEAEIDELNKAIAGAQLGAALAGSYVNPNTGQELRPTAGARIASAAAQGLMLARDTETRRAEQEAALAKARIAARSKTKTEKGFLEGPVGKEMLEALSTVGVKYSGDAALIEDYMSKTFGADNYQRFKTAMGQAVPDNTPAETNQSPFSVGDEAENPQTGEIIVWDGNSWQPKT